MPYWLETDQFADDPVWEVLAGGDPLRVDQLQALHCRLKSKASHLLTDGYLTEHTALRYARGRRQLLDRLTVPVLDQPPKLHKQGDTCECLGDGWIVGYGYRIHQFLRRNPSRAEYHRNRAQKADLRDPRLKTAVYARDGGCCRYCRSGPLSAKAGRARDRRKALTFDHVDPDRPTDRPASAAPASSWRAPAATSTRATAPRTRPTWSCCRSPLRPNGRPGRPAAWPCSTCLTCPPIKNKIKNRSPTNQRRITNMTSIGTVIGR